MESAAGPDNLDIGLPAGLTDLALGAPRKDIERLILLLVELEAQLLPALDEKDLAAVPLGRRPDELVAPGLLDFLDLDRETVEIEEVWRQIVHLVSAFLPQRRRTSQA